MTETPKDETSEAAERAVGVQAQVMCRRGSHDLVVIYRNRGLMSDDVVRWCQRCGSVVVDTDYDGRTNAGQVMKMRAPLLVQGT